MKRVKRFGVYQTSKVVAITLFVASLLLMILFSLIFRFLPGNKILGYGFGGGLFFFLLPILYGVMGFIITAITCLIYNFISEWTGGIEVEFENRDEESVDEESEVGESEDEERINK